MSGLRELSTYEITSGGKPTGRRSAFLHRSVRCRIKSLLSDISRETQSSGETVLHFARHGLCRCCAMVFIRLHNQIVEVVDDISERGCRCEFIEQRIRLKLHTIDLIQLSLCHDFVWRLDGGLDDRRR